MTMADNDIVLDDLPVGLSQRFTILINKDFSLDYSYFSHHI